MPYIRPFISEPVDWTPLKCMNTKYTKFDIPPINEEDVWQFTTFLIDPAERLHSHVRDAQLEPAKI
jgi:homospermidine synthase